MKRSFKTLGQTFASCCLMTVVILQTAGFSSANDPNLPFRTQRPFALSNTVPTCTSQGCTVPSSTVPSQKAVLAEASKVHVVLMVYGPSTAFGNACRADIAGFKVMLEDGFEAKRDRLVYHDYTGKNPATGMDWSPREILENLETMRLGSNESIVVFHSGHGHIQDLNRPEETQYLSIDRGRMSRKTLRDKLRAMNPRGLTILTDCCSSHVPSLAMNRGSDAQRRFNAVSVRNLFLRLAGEVSITAAENGTGALPVYSGANPGAAGSAFTVALLRLLADGDRTYQNWTDLFPVLKRETHAASSNIPGCSPHYAHSFAINEFVAP